MNCRYKLYDIRTERKKIGLENLNDHRNFDIWRHIVELPAAEKMCGVITPPKRNIKETIEELLIQKLLCPFIFKCDIFR